MVRLGLVDRDVRSSFADALSGVQPIGDAELALDRPNNLLPYIANSEFM